MASNEAKLGSGGNRWRWQRVLLAVANFCLAGATLWLGMSIPSYFRSVSPLVLEAAGNGTETLGEMALREVQAGRPGIAQLLLDAEALTRGHTDPVESLPAAGIQKLIDQHPPYRWSGGPAPFYEQFVKQAQFLREDETAVIPTLLPGAHRQQMSGFLAQSPNQNVHNILETRKLSGWSRFYPVYSTSGPPLEATILATALMEQSSALPPGLQEDLLQGIETAKAGNVQHLESIYLSVLTLGRHLNWLQLKSLIGKLQSVQQLVFTAQSVQEDPDRIPLLYSALTQVNDPRQLVDYLLQHEDRGWEGLRVALGMGMGAVETLVEFHRPVYQPPAFWNALPSGLRDSQQSFKGFAESFPQAAIGVRALAFALCGMFLVGILRSLLLQNRPSGTGSRRLLINLDSLVGGVLVMLLVWVLIEPGLLHFRPNEEGSLQINLAQVLPDDTIPINESLTKMIDQVTILVLLLFFVVQLLVFIFCLLKIAEVRKQSISPEIKLRILDNEENLFDLGLYVGLSGTVGSLILVVLNVVDASLMAAYASTLFGIIFVALLKVGFLRPYRKQLILEAN